MYIKLKSNVDVVKKNEIMASMGTRLKFITEQGNQNWLSDINTNPEHPLKHLKPDGRDMTMEELSECFPRYTEVGLIDVYLSNEDLTDTDKNALLNFIIMNTEDIEYITDSADLIEETNCDVENHSILKSLEKPDEEPEMLSAEEQYIPDLEEGLMVCKDWADKGFKVVFGNVESPMFMKKRIYKDDDYNNLYYDSNGFPYMLLPLNDFSHDFGEKVFSKAWGIGLREHPYFFLPFIYHQTITNPKSVAEEFTNHYSKEELEERLKMVLRSMKTELKVIGTSVMKLEKNGLFKLFYPFKRKDSIITHKIQLINAILISLKKHYGKVFRYDVHRSYDSLEYFLFFDKEFVVNL
jgi:hypothetical protein